MPWRATGSSFILLWGKAPNIIIAFSSSPIRLSLTKSNRLALSALSSADPKAILTSRSAKIEVPHLFNISIPIEGAPITNQRQSGRCWLFASTNVFRVAITKLYNLEKFELSQAYLFFYDKLEKANYFLENILDTVDEELSGRLVQRLLEQPVSDGGQWDMVANLVAKYGLVPQSLYPDSWSAQASAGINQLITTKLREDALILRKLVKAGKDTAEAKEKMMREIHLILTLTLGPPPSPNEEFIWTYKDKDEKVHELTTTPVKFAKELDSPKAKTITSSAVSEWFSLVNDPRNEYYSLLTVSRLGNIVGGRGITYVNVPIAVLKDAAIKMLKAGLPVFFGSDVGKFSDRVSGVMDPGLIDYELGFNVKLGLSKAERLQTGESAMTHAMVLTAVHIVEEEGKEVIKRWRVENSWGEDSGEKGWFVMSDRWLDEFVYQIVVEPGFVDKSVRDVLGGKAKVLPLWDPMGSLA
jgi:bleomycin hydrolase